MRGRLNRHFFVAAALALCLGVVLLLARALHTLHTEQWQHAEQTNATLAHTLEQNIARTIDSFDRSLVGVVSSLEQFDTAHMSPTLRSALLFDHSLRSRGRGEVAVLDIHGDVVIESGSVLPRAFNLADRDYFRAHMRENFRGLYVGRPVQARLSGGAASLPLSRAYYHSDGSLGGVVVGTIRSGYFEELFASVDLGPSSRIVLWRDDGSVLAQFSPGGTTPLQLGPQQLQRMLASEAGTFIDERPAPGDPAMLHAFRRLSDYPLIVSVDQPVATIDARWRSAALVPALLALVLIAAFLALTWAFLRELDRRQAVSAQLARAEHDLRTILNNLPSRVGYWDAALRNRFANDGYRRLLGATPAQLASQRLPELLGEPGYAPFAAHVEHALQGQRQMFELDLPADDAGGARHLRCTLVPDLDAASARVQGFFVQIDDLTERKRMEDLLFEEKERARLTLQSIGDAVLCTDAEGRITFINPAAEDLTGWQSFDAAGQPVEQVAILVPAAGDVAPQDAPPHPMLLALARGRGHAAQRGQVLRRRGGGQVEVEETARPIHDREGQVSGAVMVLRDVTHAVELARRLEHLARHDALTGLPNRLALQERAAQAIALAGRDGQQLAVMYLDLDGFKQVNDTLGHDAGDLLLAQVAQRFLQAVRASDTVCRQGGDEFIVLLPQVSGAEQAAAVARKLLDACAPAFMLGGTPVHVGLSGGVALYPRHGDGFEALARCADAALYAAKRRGRGCVMLAPAPGQADPLWLAGLGGPGGLQPADS
ncbi:diguanylate cyclase domain-containing protein [Melaminivora sp.]|uniref:diguanylate cyclase domain-containing protein n=1 Tax=Melaminivora sp. TaxID=1933032 RepID=UPI0028A7AC12|nr:diguanylate cyclase [Melaminivora sp.]